MKCPVCVSEGRRSTVQVGISTATLMSGSTYYDEDGRYHNHDPNYTTTGYSCSNGHEWTGTSDAPKCWCGKFG